MNLEPGETYDDAYIEALHHSYGLRNAGYDTCLIEWRIEPRETLRTVEDEGVDLIFNASSTNEVAFCEIFQLPYVGSGLDLVATDKVFRKAVVAYNGFVTPKFVVAKNGNSVPHIAFDYPVFVKPLSGRGSAGIGDDNIVKSPDRLQEVVEKITRGIGQPALIEEYVQGREITVGIVGYRNPIALPAVEVEYNAAAANTFEHKMYDREIIHCPTRLPAQVENEIQRICLSIYQLLNARDYARIDMIVDEHFVPHFLELNTFAGLTMETEVEDGTQRPHPGYMGYAARSAGMNQAELLDAIVRSALDRYGLAI